MKTKEDYLNLLDETIKYYSEDPSRRAADNNGCFYKLPNGNMCAVGRCVENEIIFSPIYRGTVRFVDRKLEINGFKLDDVLKPEYRGFSLSMWEELQRLHDSKEYWDSKSLTQNGLNYVESIKGLIDVWFNEDKE